MLNLHQSQAQIGMDSYTDLSSVNSIRSLGREDKNQALEKIAKQFESMMMQMMMKSMRSANEVFAEGNIFSSHEGDMYQQMYDDQMSLSLSEGRGLGIADIMVRQLKSRFGNEEKSNQTLSDLGEYLNNRISSPAISGKEETSDITANMSSSVDEVKKEVVNFVGDIKQFVESLYPMAKEAAKKLGVSPELLVAQSALETGWGRNMTTSQSGEKSLNLFNIKADKRWGGEKVTVPTLEIKDGMPVKEIANFRSYHSLQHSFDDYVDFLSGSNRYQKAISANDNEKYINELSDAGYATDPDYAKKVLQVMNSDSMQQAVKSVIEKIPQSYF